MIGTEVKRLRLEKMMTQEDLAGKIGRSKPYISQIETRKRKPSMTTLESLAAGLGVPAATLLKEGPLQLPS